MGISMSRPGWGVVGGSRVTFRPVVNRNQGKRLGRGTLRKVKQGSSVKWLLWVGLALPIAACGADEAPAPTSTTVAEAAPDLTGAPEGVETTSTTPTTTSTTLPPPPVEDLLFVPESFRDRLVELVEETQFLRGLRFSDPLPVKAVTSQELAQQVRSRLEDGAGLSDWDQPLFRLLGLIDAESDWTGLLALFRSQPAPGLYDVSSRTLWLVSALEEPTPLEEMTLVGEIAKALVDLNLGIWERQERFAARGDSDSLTAMGAMAEADSTLVELLFLEGLSEAARRQVTEQAWDLAAEAEPYPAFVGRSLGFASGPALDYLQRLYQLGGWDMINDAHRDPPVSTEQILALGVERLDPVLLPRPKVTAPTGYREVTDAVWGQWGWDALLASALGAEGAFPAAWGWGGDRYLVFSDGTDVALVVDYIGDTPGDTEEMRVALASFVQRNMAVGEGRWRDGGTEYYDDDYAWVSGEGDLVTFIAATDVEAGRALRSSRGG